MYVSATATKKCNIAGVMCRWTASSYTSLITQQTVLGNINANGSV